MNLNNLAKDLSQHILNREYYETRHGYEEDDALIGLLNLGTAVFKHNPPYKMIPDAHVSSLRIGNVNKNEKCAGLSL